MAKVTTEAAHAFTVALLEAFYEKPDEGRVTSKTVETLRGNDDFMDNDEFVFAFEESIWTEENKEKFGSVDYDDVEEGYYLSGE